MVSERTLQGAGGPIMIYSTSYKMAKRGLQAFFMFLALLSITLAFMNLLPLGALDGGQWLFVTIDANLGKLWNKKLPDIVKATLNIVSWIFFIFLTLVLSYRDILRLFF